MPAGIQFGRALSLVENAVEYHARILAGKYQRYNEADELRRAMKLIRTVAKNNVLSPIVS